MLISAFQINRAISKCSEIFGSENSRLNMFCFVSEKCMPISIYYIIYHVLFTVPCTWMLPTIILWPPWICKKNDLHQQERPKMRKKKKCCLYLGTQQCRTSKKRPNIKALSEFLLLFRLGYKCNKVQKKYIPIPRNLFSFLGSCLMSTFLPRCQQSIVVET